MRLSQFHTKNICQAGENGQDTLPLRRKSYCMASITVVSFLLCIIVPSILALPAMSDEIKLPGTYKRTNPQKAQDGVVKLRLDSKAGSPLTISASISEKGKELELAAVPAAVYSLADSRQATSRKIIVGRWDQANTLIIASPSMEGLLNVQQLHGKPGEPGTAYACTLVKESANLGL